MQCRFRPCCEISIHSLVKRETGLQIVCRLAISNFNPLPRKEGDCKKAVQSLGFAISIHSLVKRETARAASLGLSVNISIHSLVKRETLLEKGGAI